VVRLLLISLTFLSVGFVSLAVHAAAIDDVDPFIGTGPSVIGGVSVPGGHSGATQPAATVPFGMVQLGPDTDHPETSGYSFTNQAIRDFSFTHLSGAGCGNTAEFGFLPFIGGVGTAGPQPVSFSHIAERASPGLYDVTLANNIRVELTATDRTGVARVTFPQSSVGQWVGFTVSVNRAGTGRAGGDITFVDPTHAVGNIRTGGFCNSKTSYLIFASIETSQPAAQQTFVNGVATFLYKNDGRPLELKVGLSYFSRAGAQANREAETKDLSFDQVLEQARTKWTQALSTIQVTTTDEAARRSFYTAFYHSLLHPNIGSDVDGHYVGFDQHGYQKTNRVRYINFSGWDIYRTQVQLISLLFPKRASDIVSSLVDTGAECGALPKWALANTETNIMDGDPPAIIIANMYAFGAKDFDTAKAFALMKKSATDPGASCQGHLERPDLEDYARLAYVPYDHFGGGTATSLEYSSADFALAKFSEAIGESAFAIEMKKRSAGWQSLFDPSTKLIRPLDSAGNWLTPFDAVTMDGFVEGNAAQYTWMIPFDVATLISKMGGEAAMIQKLDAFMSQTNAGMKLPNLYLGNEPGFGVPWLYLWAHAPSKTQAGVRDLFAREFLAGPNGLPGNDDLGATSAWAVWAAVGLYPAIPGSGVLVIGSPAFSQIVITPETHAPMTLRAPSAESNVFVQTLSLDGQPWTRTWLTVDEFNQHREMNFTMSATPQAWGTQAGAEPPSNF